MRGHISKMDDGRYRGVVYLGKDKQGKKKQKWFYGSKDEVEELDAVFSQKQIPNKSK
jgi:hypothetical protein